MSPGTAARVFGPPPFLFGVRVFVFLPAVCLGITLFLALVYYVQEGFFAVEEMPTRHRVQFPRTALETAILSRWTVQRHRTR